MGRVPIALIALLGLTGIAHADVISMAEESCLDAAKGDACEGEQGRGTCQTGECCRLDYSQMPPSEVCSECLVCTPGGGSGSDDDDGCDATAAGGPLGPAVVGLGIALALGLRRRRRR